MIRCPRPRVASGSNHTRLTNNTGNDESPRFSPDGTKIAFAAALRRQQPGEFEFGDGQERDLHVCERERAEAVLPTDYQQAVSAIEPEFA